MTQTNQLQENAIRHAALVKPHFENPAKRLRRFDWTRVNRAGADQALRHFLGREMMKKTLAASCVSVLALTLIPNFAYAEQVEGGEAANSGAIGDIIVTANKREQSANDVGLTIQAATAETLTERGITGPSDLTKLVSGFTFTQSIYSTPVFTLRGIGLYDATFGSAPAVAIYTDQVPRNFPVMSDALDLDLERVEVLKGPQGTLFGQSSTGGAINYILAKPTDSMSAGANVSYERFGRVETSGFLSGPVTDDVNVRIAVKGVTGGAWQKSLSRPDDENGSTRKLQGRFTVDYAPTDALKVQLTATAAQDHSDPQAPQYVGSLFNVYSASELAAANANPATANPYGYVDEARYASLTDPNSPGYDATFLTRRNAVIRRLHGGDPARQTGAQAILGTTPTPNSARAAEWGGNALEKARNDYYQLSGRFDYDLTDNVTFTSITALAKQELAYGQDVDGTVALISDVDVSGHVKTFNQEVRLSGSTPRLRWITGASYDNLRSFQRYHFSASDYSGSDPFYDQTGGLFSLPIEFTQNDFSSRLRTYGFYGNAEFDITDRLSVQGGVRYTKDKHKASYCYYDPASDTNQNTALLFYLFEGAFGNPGLPPIQPGECFVLGDGTNGTTFGRAIRAPFEDELAQDNVSYRVGLNYKFASDALLYGTVSRGYKTGIFSAIGASSTAQYNPAVQERVIAYEAGVKMPLADNAVQLNAAAFYYDYANKQVRGRTLDPVFGLLEKMLNIPESSIYGAEVSLLARPISGLSISANATYLKSEITSDYAATPSGAAVYNSAGFTGNFKDSPLPYTPKFSGNLDGQYEHLVGGNMRAFVGGTLVFQTRQNATFHNDVLLADEFNIPGYTTVDARLGVEAQDGAWKATLFGRNIFDKTYTTAVTSYLDTRFRYTGKPAVYGISLQYRWGGN